MRRSFLPLVLAVVVAAAGCLDALRSGERVTWEFVGVEAMAQYETPWNGSLVAEALLAQGFVLAMADEAQVVTENASRPGFVVVVRAAPSGNESWDLVYEGRLNETWLADEAGATADVWLYFEPDASRMWSAFEASTGLRWTTVGYTLLGPS